MLSPNAAPLSLDSSLGSLLEQWLALGLLPKPLSSLRLPPLTKPRTSKLQLPSSTRRLPGSRPQALLSGTEVPPVVLGTTCTSSSTNVDLDISLSLFRSYSRLRLLLALLFPRLLARLRCSSLKVSRTSKTRRSLLVSLRARLLSRLPAPSLSLSNKRISTISPGELPPRQMKLSYLLKPLSKKTTECVP